MIGPEDVGKITVTVAVTVYVVSERGDERNVPLFQTQPLSFIPVLEVVFVNMPIIVAAIARSTSMSSIGSIIAHGREYRHLFRLLQQQGMIGREK